MPTRPSGRVSYEGMNSALAGGLTPAPMGVAEAELWPRLQKAMEMLEVAARKSELFEGDKFRDLYAILRSGVDAFKSEAGTTNKLTLEQILNPDFQLQKSAWTLNPSEASTFDPKSGNPGFKMAKGITQYMDFNKLKKAVQDAEEMLSK